MHTGKSKTLIFILSLLPVGLVISQMSGTVVSSWAEDLIRSVHISGSAATLKEHHVSGADSDWYDSANLTSAWDEVSALEVHLSGTSSSPTGAVDAHISGTHSEVKISAGPLQSRLPEPNHVPRAEGIPEARIFDSETGKNAAHLSGSETGLEKGGDHLSGTVTPALLNIQKPVETIKVSISEEKNFPIQTPKATIAPSQLETDVSESIGAIHISGASIGTTVLEVAHLSGAVTQTITAPIEKLPASKKVIPGPPKLKSKPTLPRSPKKELKIRTVEEVLASIPSWEKLNAQISGSSTLGDEILGAPLSGASAAADGILRAHVSGSKTQLDFLSKETDSKDSYKHRQKMREGSKSKRSHRPDLKNAPPGYSHKKSEGSKSKRYGHGKASHGKPYGTHKGYVSHKGGHKYSGAHKAISHMKDPFQHVMKFKRMLSLTDEQLRKIRALQFDYKKIRIMSKADHEIAHMEMDRIVHSGGIDESGIRGVANRISNIKSKKIHAVAKAKIGLLKVLTDEQRQRVAQMYLHHSP